MSHWTVRRLSPVNALKPQAGSFCFRAPARRVGAVVPHHQRLHHHLHLHHQRARLELPIALTHHHWRQQRQPSTETGPETIRAVIGNAVASASSLSPLRQSLPGSRVLAAVPRIRTHIRRRCIDPRAMVSAYSAYHSASAAAAANAPANNAGPVAAPQASPASNFTTTALGRWSVVNKPLPAVDDIKVLHVYDFDNTRELRRVGVCVVDTRLN